MAEVLIVVPVYNAEPYLAACLDSVLAQSYTDWRLVVIDDGSRDASPAIAQSYAQQDGRIEAYQQPNSGVAAARNTGLQKAGPSNRYILLLDNDDFLNPDTLETLVRHLELAPAAPAVYGLPRDVDREGSAISDALSDAFGYKRLKATEKGPVEMTPDEPAGFDCFVLWPCIATPGQALLRASALQVAGEFDPLTVPSDDWDMWLRLSLQGAFVYLPRFIMNKRTHGENVSGKGKVMAVAEPRLRAKLAMSPDLNAAQRRLALLGHRDSHRIKLSWAKADWDRKNLVGAAKGVYRAGRSYLRYMRTPYLPAK